MKVEKIIITTVEQEVQFKGLTLLSEEEYFQSKENIPKVDFWWWLRSHGLLTFSIACVLCGGTCTGFNASFDDIAVRPALIINQESSLQIGDKFKFYGHNWTVISEKHALCDEKFCYMAFRNNWRSKNANEYKASDIKKYLDSEWDKMKESEEDDTRRTN